MQKEEEDCGENTEKCRTMQKMHGNVERMQGKAENTGERMSKNAGKCRKM